MRSIIVGIVIGSVVGVMFGATVVAPRLENAANHSTGIGTGKSKSASIGETIKKAARAIAPETSMILPPAGPQRPTLRWRMASAWPESLPLIGKMASRIGRNLWNVSEGGMELKFYDPDSLVPVDGMFDAVASGTIDAAFGAPEIWIDKAPALKLFASIPFGPEADEYLAWMYFGGGLEILNEVYRPLKVYGLLCGMVPPEASGWFRRKFTGPEDFQGLKMRSSGLAAQVLKNLGVQTLQLKEEDIFVAFEDGKIDAAEISLPSTDLKLGYPDIASYYYFPGWHQPAAFLNLIINKDKWEGLSKSRQSQIETVCGDNVRHGLAQGNAMQYDALKEITAKGIKIQRWPNTILVALQQSWDKVQTEQSAADTGFKRAWRSLVDFRKNYSIWKELSSP